MKAFTKSLSLLTLATALFSLNAIAAPAPGTPWPFHGKDGTELQARSWKAKRSNAVLVVVHGLRDHSGRYEDLARQLVRQGVSVYAFDLRGHGLSSGERVWVDYFEQYIDDLEKFVSIVSAQERGKPIFLMGHSMGGAIATRYVLERDSDVRGLVLSAAALTYPRVPVLKQHTPPAVSKVVGDATRAAGVTFPRLRLLILSPKDFSRDPEVVEENRATDPLIYHENGPARTGGELYRSIEIIRKSRQKLDIPMLALHGTADRITDPRGSRQVIAANRNPDKTLIEAQGFYHDLLHEPGKEKLEKAIISWIIERAR